jgi:hypothetical protein
MVITDKDIYISLPPLISNAEQISWNRLYNFLVANSILILAWSAVYAAELPTSLLTTGLLVAICVVGFLTSIFWFGLGIRGRGFLNALVCWGKKIEEQDCEGLKPYCFIEIIRDEGIANLPEKFRPSLQNCWTRELSKVLLEKKWYKLCGSYFTQTLIPGFFAALYIILVVASFKRPTS